jgi:hypothetical protein
MQPNDERAMFEEVWRWLALGLPNKMKCKACSSRVPSFRALMAISTGRISCVSCRAELKVVEKGMGPGLTSVLLGVGAAAGLALAFALIEVPVWLEVLLLAAAIWGVGRLTIALTLDVVNSPETPARSD